MVQGDIDEDLSAQKNKKSPRREPTMRRRGTSWFSNGVWAGGFIWCSMHLGLEAPLNPVHLDYCVFENKS